MRICNAVHPNYNLLLNINVMQVLGALFGTVISPLCYM